MLTLLKRKNNHRTIAHKTGRSEDYIRFSQTRRDTKYMIKQKKKRYALKLKDSIRESPKRFWSYVKTSTKKNRTPVFLRNDQRFVPDPKDMANMFNDYFQSIFNTDKPVYTAVPCASPPRIAENLLSNIQLTSPAVENALKAIIQANLQVPTRSRVDF